jgi:ferric-dicitrate binding protein FerR (iron transport regulator)
MDEREKLQEIWIASAVGRTDERFDKQAAYRRFAERTGIERANRLRRLRRTLVRVAAAAAVLVAVSYTSFRQGGEQVKERFAEIVIEAPLGSRTTTTLPDGSRVWLNAGSRLAYSQGFGVSDRQVMLQGEGYFEVVHNPKQPFSVETHELSVQVLGTKFDFCNYADDAEATVSLLEGRVQVNSALSSHETMILEPNQRIRMDKKSGQMHLTKINARHAMEWTNGTLFFDEAPLTDIARELERCYDVHVVLTKPELGQLHFYATFVKRDQPIEEVMKVLAATRRFSYSINGKEICITPP